MAFLLEASLFRAQVAQKDEVVSLTLRTELNKVAVYSGLCLLLNIMCVQSQATCHCAVKFIFHCCMLLCLYKFFKLLTHMESLLS